MDNIPINSTDTAVNPIISPNWVLDLRDQEVAIAGFRRTRDIFQTRIIQPVLAGPKAFSGLNVTKDKAILETVMENASSIDHAGGACATGESNNSNAVVDSQVRVFGVKGLRVVDAPTFPFLPPRHPQSTVCNSCSQKFYCSLLEYSVTV